MEQSSESPDTLALLENAAWVRRLARRLVADAHRAEDVAQDVLASALEHPPSFAGNARRLRKWLGGATRHFASHLRRRETERPSREARAARPEAGDGGAAAVDRLHLHQRLVRAVLALDEPYRSTIVQRFFDELTPREIGRRAGVPSATVRKRLSRGLVKLRRGLDREFDGDRRAWGAALTALVEAGAVAGIPLAVPLLAAVAVAVTIVVWPYGETPARDGTDEDARVASGIGVLPECEEEGHLEPPPESSDGARRPIGAQSRGGGGLASVAPEEEGTVLSGWLLEDGHSPCEPFTIEVRANEPGDSTPREVVVDQDGTFRCEELPADWSGTLRLPDTHWFLEAPPGGTIGEYSFRFLHLPAPQEALTLRTTRLPVIRGRVVDGDTGDPLADVGLDVCVGFGDGEDTPITGTRTKADGRFLVGLSPGSSLKRDRWRDPGQRSAIADVQLRVLGEGSYLDVGRFLQPEDLGPDGDVGDIRLFRGSPRYFLVRDRTGRPVEGAFVEAGWLSEPTDAEGRVLVTGLPAERESVRVGAPTYGIRRVPLGPEGRTPEDPMMVVLEKGNRLELVVLDAAGAGIENVQVRIEGEGRLFETGHPGTPTRIHKELGTGTFSCSSWMEDEGGWTVFLTDERGRVSLVDLLPGLLLGIDVLDASRKPRFSTSVHAPGFAELARYELRIEDGALIESRAVNR